MSHRRMDASGVQVLKYLRAIGFTLLQTYRGEALSNLVTYKFKESSQMQQKRTQKNQGKVCKERWAPLSVRSMEGDVIASVGS